MRPIELTVAGLHSFREKQIIRFDELAGGGVFGIFGPTGSGKSSLLDAMTLALFGNVERAANNTQGIMNHAEDRLSVSYTFELGKEKRYRIERSYKRSGDISLQSSLCRLIELSDGEEIVLADKEREVTQNVRDLLGLTNDDFTRAVVLPQGKFAEFLSLKGKERRQMLQRLFHLERYGDRLTEKLKTRTDRAESEHKEITAEQQGLGDASEETLRQARAAFTAAKQKVEENEQKLKETEKRYEQYKQLWQWQQERESVEKELRQWNEQQATIQQLENQYKQAQEADRLKPYIEELERAQTEQQEWERKAKEAQNALQTAQDEYETVKQNYENAKAKRAEQEPTLLVREEQLKQAINKQQELKKARDEWTTLKKQLDDSEQQQQQTQKQLNADEADYKKWLQTQEELKQQQENQTVPHDKRENVRKANEAAQAIETLRTSLRELEQEQKNKQSELEKQESTWQAHDQAYRQQLKAIERLLVQASEKYNKVCEAERQVEKTNHIIDQRITDQEQQREAARDQEMARILAQHLQEGGPCPVCGATHHPQPASTAETVANENTEDIEGLRESKQQGNGLLQETTKLKSSLQQLSDRLSEWMTDPSTQAANSETAGSLEPADGAEIAISTNSSESETMNTEDISATSSKETMQALAVKMKGIQQDLIALQEDSKPCLADIRKQEKQRDEAATQVHAHKQTIKEQQAKLGNISRELTEKETSWQQSFPDFTLETIQQTQKDINQADGEAAKLQDRIQKSIPMIEEKAGKIETLKKEFQQAEILVAEQKTAVNNQQKQADELERQLQEQTGGEDADQLLADTTKTLANLKQTESEQYETWQRVDQTYRQKENTMTAAKESHDQAQKRKLTAEETSEQQRAHTSFEDMEEAKQALTSEDEQQQWQQKIKQFHDHQKALQNEQQRLNKLVADREISEQDWQAVQNDYQTVKQAYNESLEQRGNAKQQQDEIEEKHARFLQLEEQRNEVATLLERLHKLRDVFRGNSFVEFVAEEQLLQVTRDASARLGQLTQQRYAIEVDSNGGFVMRDNANGGVRRPVTTLSGGETFLTSLALALSLSSQIQLRGQYPLEFFFLDEGFGTLDQELLDTVVTALEQLHVERFSVGVISHVPELRARLPVRLIVDPPEPSGVGSRTHIEKR